MIGERIKKRREELGLTQEELAKKLGYKSKSSINKIEMNKNDISQSKLIQFASVLDCSPTYFIVTDTYPALPTDKVMEYAEKITMLSPNNQRSVMQYIDFLLKENSEE